MPLFRKLISYKYTATIACCILLVFLWQITESSYNSYLVFQSRTPLSAFIPLPTTIYHTFITDHSMILSQLSFTLIRAGIGLFIGFILAFGFATTFFLFPIMRRVFLPLSFAVNSFPVVGFAPLIILAFGQGSELSIIFVSAIISYFPILISLDNAFENTDCNLLDYMKTLNASKKQILHYIVIPSSINNMLMSLKLAIPASIIGAVLGEWLGTRNGIGQIIIISLYQFKPGLLYSSLLVVVFSSGLFVLLISLLEKKLIKK